MNLRSFQLTPLTGVGRSFIVNAHLMSRQCRHALLLFLHTVQTVKNLTDVRGSSFEQNEYTFFSVSYNFHTNSEQMFSLLPASMHLNKKKFNGWNVTRKWNTRHLNYSCKLHLRLHFNNKTLVRILLSFTTDKFSGKQSHFGFIWHIIYLCTM